MTQHILKEDENEDRATMRRLATVIGCFVLATAILAVAVGIAMG